MLLALKRAQGHDSSQSVKPKMSRTVTLDWLVGHTTDIEAQVTVSNTSRRGSKGSLLCMARPEADA